jgi:hypothetical protein
MSVIIVFPDGTDWFKANWVFRQLAQDLSERRNGDAEVCKALELAQALGALDLEGMDHGLRGRVMRALSSVVEDTISGTIVGWKPRDGKEHTLYCEAISELRKRLEDQDTIDVSVR